MNVKYFPSIDRFIVSNKLIEFDLSIYNPHFEYARYISIGISIDQVNKFLIQNPQEVCIEITNKCNLLCPICISESDISKNQFLSFSKFVKILDELPDQISRLTITGGEPLLHQHISEIICHATSLDYTVLLSTNGYFPKKLLKILENNKNLLVAISLHGPELIHDTYVQRKGAFQKTIESIKCTLEYSQYVHIYTTISHQNMPYISELSDILSEFQITEHRLSLVKETGRLDDGIINKDDLISFLTANKINSPFTIKSMSSPYLFVNVQGHQEVKYEYAK